MVASFQVTISLGTMINIKGGLTSCMYTPWLEHFVNPSEVNMEMTYVYSYV